MKARTTDLATEFGVAANTVSHHASILISGEFINNHVGEDAREHRWSVNVDRVSQPGPALADRCTDDGQAAVLAIIEYLRNLVPEAVGEDNSESVTLGVAYLTDDQREQVAKEIGAVLDRIRGMSAENYERGQRSLHALGAQRLPARARQG